jgi:hypothetical protein
VGIGVYTYVVYLVSITMPTDRYQEGTSTLSDVDDEEEGEIGIKTRRNLDGQDDDSPLVFDFLKRKRSMPSSRRLDYMLSVPVP